jgi:hypothetical protein
MSDPYTGGCACGAVRYEARGEPVFQNHCQCRDCQRRSGTGHGSYLTFGGDVRIYGEATTWRVAGDSGNEKIHAFCAVCGTPVYLAFAAAADLVAVHAASLDNPARFRPAAVTYTSRGYAWETIDPALPAFDKMPSG